VHFGLVKPALCRWLELRLALEAAALTLPLRGHHCTSPTFPSTVSCRSRDRARERGQGPLTFNANITRPIPPACHAAALLLLGCRSRSSLKRILQRPRGGSLNHEQGRDWINQCQPNRAKVFWITRYLSVDGAQLLYMELLAFDDFGCLSSGTPHRPSLL
jgi:hypothetical protein